jgi:hypothetical protein
LGGGPTKLRDGRALHVAETSRPPSPPAAARAEPEDVAAALAERLSSDRAHVRLWIEHHGPQPSRR